MMADPNQLVVPPPIPKIMDYPGALGISFMIVFVSLLLFISGRFDPTKGVLTISLLIVLTMVGVITFSVFFTIPNDQTTAAVIGALGTAFGAVVTYWLMPSRDKDQN